MRRVSGRRDRSRQGSTGKSRMLRGRIFKSRAKSAPRPEGGGVSGGEGAGEGRGHRAAEAGRRPEDQRPGPRDRPRRWPPGEGRGDRLSPHPRARRESSCSSCRRSAQPDPEAPAARRAGEKCTGGEVCRASGRQPGAKSRGRPSSLAGRRSAERRGDIPLPGGPGPQRGPGCGGIRESGPSSAAALGADGEPWDGEGGTRPGRRSSFCRIA